MPSIVGMRFVVIGAYVADCVANVPQLPEWGVELLAQRAITLAPGGKALNQAVALARLGAEVTAVGVLGNDSIGKDIEAFLRKEGVSTAGIEVRQTATPICICLARPDGETAFIWRVEERAAIADATLQAAKPFIRDADAALITFEMPADAIRRSIEYAHLAGTRVVVQPAPPLANASDVKRLPWGSVDLLIPNQFEAYALVPPDRLEAPLEKEGGPLARHLGVPNIVITLGDRGCAVYADGTTRRYPAVVTDVVDTTGASDAFAATLVLCEAAGFSREHAVNVALAAAGEAVSVRGGVESMPSGAWLRAVLNG